MISTRYSGKIFLILLIFLMFPLILTQPGNAQTFGGNFSNTNTILVPTEISGDTIVSIDGNMDNFWTIVNYNDFTVGNSIPMRLYCAYDSTSLYFYLEIEFLRAWDVVNETVSFNFQSSSPINYTNNQMRDSDGMGQGVPEGFDSSGIPPSQDGSFTPPNGELPAGDLNQFSSRIGRTNYNLTKIDDRKAITITNGFYKPATDSYSVSYVDQYVYSETDDEDNTIYSYENDVDRSSCRGAAINGPYGRFYELQFDLTSEDAQNDLIVSNTDACVLYIGIQASDELEETIATPIQIQFFEPSTDEQTSTETDSSFSKVVGYIFLAICVSITVILGILTFQARSNLKKKSFRSAFEIVSEYLKEIEVAGEERSEEEIQRADSEEHQFLNWLDQEIDPSEVTKIGRPLESKMDGIVSIPQKKPVEKLAPSSDLVSTDFEESAFLHWLNEENSAVLEVSNNKVEFSEKQGKLNQINHEKIHGNRHNPKATKKNKNDKGDRILSSKKTVTSRTSVEDDDYFLNWND